MPDLEKIKKGLNYCLRRSIEEHENCPYVEECNKAIALNADKCPLLEDLLYILLRMENSGWISVADQLPENQGTVLIVKELKSGQRQIGLGYCIREYKHHDYATGEDRIEPYWVCGGNNNVIYWQALPDLP